MNYDGSWRNAEVFYWELRRPGWRGFVWRAPDVLLVASDDANPTKWWSFGAINRHQLERDATHEISPPLLWCRLTSAEILVKLDEWLTSAASSRPT